MKKPIALLGAVLLLSPIQSFATSLTVQVPQGQLRSEPTFFSKIISNVGYHNSVSVIEERGAWRLVKFKQQQGWMHISALLSSNVKLSAGKSFSGNISSKEVSLAGKGFNAEVEKEFQQKHRKLSFAWVNYMEKINIQPSELEKFAMGSDFSTATKVTP